MRREAQCHSLQPYMGPGAALYIDAIVRRYFQLARLSRLVALESYFSGHRRPCGENLWAAESLTLLIISLSEVASWDSVLTTKRSVTQP